MIDPAETAERRAAAAGRVQLIAGETYRVIARPAGSAEKPLGHSAIVMTPVGPVRAELSSGSEAVGAARTGIGISQPPSALDRSWASALTALRLSSDREPVVRADELGAILLLAEAVDSTTTDTADLLSLRGLAAQPRTLAVLDALAATDSVRAAALELGLHHSTLQDKAAELSTALGFDLRSQRGRTRLSLALSVYRLTTTRFD